MSGVTLIIPTINRIRTLKDTLDSYYNLIEKRLIPTIDQWSIPYIRGGFVSEALIFCLIPFGIAVLFVIYMFPTKVARKTEHAQTTAIAWLNMLFGCTIICWVAMLIWANSVGEKKAKPVTAVPEKSVTDKLTELNNMKDSGLITEEEYNSKRQEMLSKM